MELRQNLLHRNGRGVTTTEAGKLLLEHGRGILHQIERAKEDLGKVRGALAGRVAVGLPPSIAKMLTVPLTREFRKRLPNAALSISEGLSMFMQEGLLAGRLDIALLYNALPSPQLETFPLMEEALFLISPKVARSNKGPVLLKDVALLPLVIPSRPNAIRMVVETQMADIGCRPSISVEISGISAILDLVADGAGYAVLPKHALATVLQPNLFTVRSIIEPKLVSKLSLATAAGRATTQTQNAMLKLIEEIALKILPSPVPLKA